MSGHQNHREYDQLTKLYDECLHYLKENHDDLQTIFETEEPTYEIIKEKLTNDNEEHTAIDKSTEIIERTNITNDDHEFKNENPISNHNGFIIVDGEQNNLVEIAHEANEARLNKIHEDIVYETLNPAVKLSDHEITEITSENNQLALVKYNERNNINFENDDKEAEIQLIINNDELEAKATEINSSSNERLDKENNEHVESKLICFNEGNKSVHEKPIAFRLENEVKSTESLSSAKSDRLRKLSQQLPRIIITSSTTSLGVTKNDRVKIEPKITMPRVDKLPVYNITRTPQAPRTRKADGEFPKRLVSKSGLENVALISNVPFEKIRLLNDTFHTLINLRWRWIVIGTVVVHFLIWLVFAMFWYITALAHYDFEPDPPKRSCVTGGKDFVTIFLASVEAQTTIGFGDRTIDEECPEAIFLFIMQLILGTGLSGVLTCVVYAKLTRPEKLSRDGVGFSKKAVISMRDGRLCLMIRAWDLNYDHIISSEFTTHFINTHRTKEGEIIRYYAQTLTLQQRQFLLWPVTLVHVIDSSSPLYKYGPDVINHSSYEITVSLKGASASMGTFTQSQTSYLPKEIVWGHRFPPVVKYDCRKQKYVIDHKKLDVIEAVETPYCSGENLNRTSKQQSDISIPRPSTPNSFSEKMAVFQLGRTSSFRNKNKKSNIHS